MEGGMGRSRTRLVETAGAVLGRAYVLTMLVFGAEGGPAGKGDGYAASGLLLIGAAVTGLASTAGLYPPAKMNLRKRPKMLGSTSSSVSTSSLFSALMFLSISSSLMISLGSSSCSPIVEGLSLRFFLGVLQERMISSRKKVE